MARNCKYRQLILGLSALAFLSAGAIASPKELASPFASSSERTQQERKKITVKGEVYDSDKLPLVGVRVTIKGEKGGTVTDVDGKFTLNNVPANGTIQISYIGMKPIEEALKGRTFVKFYMKEDATTLEELTVTTGYQDVKKERMTGAVSTISAGDIKNLNIKSMDQVFAGTISGVSAVTSGRPGATTQIHVRGINSLTGNTQPIWIVDGMPLQGEVPSLSATGGSITPELFQSGIGNISPDDIESITVLKDAAASAIYGARAANGVIVVKTKSGRAGKTTYNLTAHFGLSARPENNLAMMNSEQKLRFEREMYMDTGLISIGRAANLMNQVSLGIITREEADAEIQRLSGINTDWFKELYKPGFNTQINASMSGGTEKTKYYNSISFLNEEGTEYNNVFRRLRVSSKLSHNITPKLKFDTQLAATYREDQRSASSINTLTYALFANPYEQPDEYDLSWDMTQSKTGYGLAWNTLNAKEDILNNTQSSRYIDASLMGKLSWDILDGLRFDSQGVVYVSSNNNRTVQGEKTYTNYISNWARQYFTQLAPNQVNGSLKEGTSYSTSFNFRNALSYSLALKDKHFIDLYAGQEISAQVNYASYNYSPMFDQLHRVVGFPELPKNTDMKQINFAALGGTGRFESKLSSFFLNGTYSYDDKYVLSSSVRYDGSDIIGNNNQFTPLWNVSGKWNLHREEFFKNDLFDELALRVGYGYTGSIDKSAFPFVVINIDNRIEYDGMIVPNSFTYANPNVKWQTKKDFNVGAEMSLWKGRVRFGANYYHNFVFDLLDSRSLPYSSGRGSVRENVANVVNKGWELDMSLSPIRRPNFYWDIRANVAINKNTITSTYYKNIDEIALVRSGAGNSYFIQDYPVAGWFGYRFAEVDPETGNTIIYSSEDGEKFAMDLLSNATLGLKAPPAEYLGEFYPPVVGGLSTNINWKQFVLTMSFEYKFGNMIRSFSTFGRSGSNNRHVSDLNRWRAPGDIAGVPAITAGRSAYRDYMYDVMLERGDYFRNTFMSLGYNLPSRWTQALGLQFARITFTTNNLFTWTAYKGIDPALMGRLGYPNSRRYNLSFNISF